MTVIVKKFGGSSLESLQRIEQVAEMIIGSYQDHKQIVVVVSAMYGETDRLIQQAGFFQNDPEPREYAALVSTGECVSMSLLCLALIAKGYRAVSLSGAQAGIITDSNYRKAQLLQVQPDRIIKELKQENIVIVAGFQGMDVHGDITTLGRGGSDTTAVAIAAALDASECQIYTDVDGVYSADPKIAPKARKLDSIHIHAMHELASVGAKVLQTRAVELCGQHKIPTRVLSSYKPGSGTLIAHDHIELVQPQVYAITYDRNATKVEIVGIPNAKQMMMMWLTSMMAGGFEVDLLNYSLADQDSSGHLSLVVALDFSTLRLEKDNGIGSAMKKLRNSMLVSVRFKGRQELMQFLIVYQFRPERWIVLKIQEYVNAILKHHSKSLSNSSLPFIYSIVLFSGKRQWLYPGQIKGYLSPEFLQLFSEQVGNTVQLIDLHRIDDKILDSHGLATVVEKVLKYGPQYGITDVLEYCKIGLKRYVNYPNEVDIILNHLLNVCKDAKADADKAIKWCYKNLWETAGETMVTIAEQLRAEGMQRGWLEGEQQGILRGRAEGKQRIIKLILSRGHDAETIEALTGISVEEIKALAESRFMIS